MPHLVAVVDDDLSVRQSLDRLIRSVRLDAKVFASAEEFLEDAHVRKPDCLILDVRLPGMSGIDLHRRLLARESRLPTIFITAHGSDDHARSQAVSNWTVAYLIKPFSGDDLLNAIDAALNWEAGG
jgi:FixJ family two-component response regulator